MADTLIRNVPAVTIAKLKQRARSRGRSLQAEALESDANSGDAFVDEVARLRSEGRLSFDTETLDAFRISVSSSPCTRALRRLERLAR